MKQILTIILTLLVSISFAQDKKEDKEHLLALKKANNYVYKGNNLVKEDNFIDGEVSYRKALSNNPNSVVGNYNLANAYYNKGNYEESLYRQQQAANNSTSKEEKHRAFHNIGNILMKNKKCKEAVEAFKSALRNNPTDDETRYNLALAKACAKNQQQNKDQNKDNKDNKENKDNKDKKDNKDQQKDQDKEKQEDKNKEGDNKDKNKDQGDQKDNKGDDKKEDQGKPKDKKDDNGKQGDKKDDKNKQPPKPQQGRMSPQQIKNLLEAMNNQEKKVQKKMDAVKEKGSPIKTDKDW